MDEQPNRIQPDNSDSKPEVVVSPSPASIPSLPPTQPVNHQPDVPRAPTGRSKRKFVLLLILITLIALAVGAVYAAKGTGAKKANHPTLSRTTKSAPSTGSASSQLKTFTWKYEGLSIKYPGSWNFFNPDNVIPDMSTSTDVVLQSNKTQSVTGVVPSVDGGATTTFTGMFDVELWVHKPGDISSCNYSDDSKGGNPSDSDYITKITPFDMPNYKTMNIIEDGGQSSSTVAEIAVTDQPVQLGITTAPYLQEVYASKTHPGQLACISAGFFGHAGDDSSYSTYVALPKDTFEKLPDYQTAMSIIKSVSY